MRFCDFRLNTVGWN